MCIRDRVTGISLLKDEQGRKILYTHDDSGTYTGNILQEDGTWVQEDASWLTDSVGKAKGSIRRIEKGDDGSLFAVYYDDDYTHHIVKTMDGVTAAAVNIPDLASGGKDRISCGWKIMETGNVLIAYMSNELVLYNGADGSEIRSFQLGNSGVDDVNDLLDVEGNRILAPNEDSNGFVVYDADTGKQVDSILLEEKDYVEGVMRFSGMDAYLYLDSVGLRHMPVSYTHLDVYKRQNWYCKMV